MITKIKVKNFKKLDFELDFEDKREIVLVGPNNSGKTSVLQAIALWELGLRKWCEAKQNSKTRKAEKRIGLLITRSEISSTPVVDAKQLWKNLQVRKGSTQNILIEIFLEGYTLGKRWALGFEFNYANKELMHCRIAKKDDGSLMEIPDKILEEKIGFLPPMSGLVEKEDRIDIGSILSRIGEGRTAEILRNLCWIVWSNKKEKWNLLVKQLNEFFGILLGEPNYQMGKITLTYTESDKNKKMDLANSGRGFQQVLLILAFLYSGESTVILLDEPDAHLEFLRQKEIYKMLVELVQKENSQLIIATHSEAILDEASKIENNQTKHLVVAFLGKQPHVIKNKGQLSKSLKEIRFDQYLQAEQKKWVLYLEGSTDFDLLKAFAKVLKHPVEKYLNSTPFVVDNLGEDLGFARKHFFALREAVTETRGIAIFDRNLADKTKKDSSLKELAWKRNEIENYLPIPEVLERYVTNQTEKSLQTDLFQQHDLLLMKETIKRRIPPAALEDKNDSWWFSTKMSDDFLDKIFREYLEKLKMPLATMGKNTYYLLAELSQPDELDTEITEKLDAILEVAKNTEIT
ncbi:AAA family ATPase [bacterium]|nr:AAA family ATPase [bacterium]